MQLWCFIKIHLCTTSHYTSATTKDIQKHFTEDVESVQHSSVFFFFLILLFCCSEAFLWLLWWWRNVTLVCDYLYEVCIRFPPTWVIAFFVFLRLPFFFFSFLIKLTNNKRAGADRKSMRLGQPCGLRRRPTRTPFMLGMTRPSGPHHMAARLNKKPLSDRPRRAEAESSAAAQTATTVQF